MTARYENKTTPCRWCGDLTEMLETQSATRAFNLEYIIRYKPEVARKIRKILGAVSLEAKAETR